MVGFHEYIPVVGRPVAYGIGFLVVAATADRSSHTTPTATAARTPTGRATAAQSTPEKAGRTIAVLCLWFGGRLLLGYA